jgi:hypothetical protein
MFCRRHAHPSIHRVAHDPSRVAQVDGRGEFTGGVAMAPNGAKPPPTTATPACAATRRAPLSQALCLATATQQPTTSRHRRQREHIAAASRAGPRKARLQKDDEEDEEDDDEDDDEEDDLRFEAALRRMKDSKGSARPLNRREAFRAVWRARGWGSDADADLAEKRFTGRLCRYRAGHVAPPAEWLLPGSCLAEALGL